MPGAADSFVFRAKVRGLADGAATAASHVALLLADANVLCAAKTGAAAADARAAVCELSGQLAAARTQLAAAAPGALAYLSGSGGAPPAPGDDEPPPGPGQQLTQLQKQLGSTAALDGCLRAVGGAYAALLALSARDGAAVAAAFFDGDGGEGGASMAPSRVLKLDGCGSMKRLKNGDVYRVSRRRAPVVTGAQARVSEVSSLTPRADGRGVSCAGLLRRRRAQERHRQLRVFEQRRHV